VATADPNIRGRDHDWKVGDVVRVTSRPYGLSARGVQEGWVGIIRGFPNDWDTEVLFPMVGHFTIWSARLEVVGHIEE